MMSSVHPRVCGEHGNVEHAVFASAGSSPRVRGTLDQNPVPFLRGRFIPACAGNTGRLMLLLTRLTVHPRVCGEHWNPLRQKICQTGSSPRVRGTLPTAHTFKEGLRFIPACAGNTSSLFALCGVVTVHPRVCGEHVSLPSVTRTQRGSSPRVRGTPRR